MDGINLDMAFGKMDIGELNQKLKKNEQEIFNKIERVIAT